MKHIPMAAAVLAVAALAHTTLADDKKFSLADLKSLVADKSYVEAVQHLGDVSPAERKAEWLAVAGQAGAGVIAAAPPDQVAQVMVTIEQQYPTMLRSPVYAAARADAAPAAFTACFAGYDADSCRTAALKFVDADPGNGKLALAIAKVARTNMYAYAAVPFFKRAVAANKPALAQVCKDDDLQMAVVAAFGLPFKDALLADARPIAAGACWDDLKKPLLAALAKPDNSYYKENICDFMRGKSVKETGDLSKLCDPGKGH